MRYRDPSKRPSSAWGVFLDRMARERDWSQTRMFEELHAGLGMSPKSRAAYLDILAGKRDPSPGQAQYLRSYFRDGPLDELVEERVGTQQADLIAALAAQTEALNRLVASLDRLVVPAVAAGIQDGLRAAGVLPGAASSPASRPPAQRD